MADEPDTLGVYFEGRTVGTVAVEGSGRFTFEYAQGWVSDANAFAISRSLPLRGSQGQADAGHAFFSNLLPEGPVRELVARHLCVSPGNDFALLDALGGECAGALVISRVPPTSKAPSYRVLDERKSARPVAAWRSRRDQRHGRHPTLAGWRAGQTSGEGGRIHAPFAGGRLAEYAHLEVANQNDSGFPENELFVTRLAGLCRVPTVTAELRAIGKTRHLLVRRYDRVVDADGTIHRLHQEDLCQALGVAPARKYEQEGGPRFDQCFGLVEDASVEPALDTRSLLRWLVFTLIVGNADGHAKNRFSSARTAHGWRRSTISFARPSTRRWRHASP